MKIVQCVPNFSEGKDLAKVEEIVSVIKNKPGYKLISYEPDPNYNRTVVTLVGDPEAIYEAVIALVAKTTELIDLTKHHGEHPRMGAMDVIPFVPIHGITMQECVEIARKLGSELAERFNIPIFLYEEAATCSERVNLADIRRGEFEGMAKKLKNAKWQPDFGQNLHPTAGVIAVGARFPLIAYNINLGTADISIANAIAKTIRHSSGGFRYIKAGAAALEDKGIVQVTMNITNYQKTSVYRVFEAVKIEAKRYGVPILGSEIIGLIPLEALTQSLAYYLGLTDFNEKKVLEAHLIASE